MTACGDGRVMNQSRLILIATLLVFVGCAGLGFRIFWLPKLAPHEGDGTFKDLSHRYVTLPSLGYSIKMPEGIRPQQAV